MSSTVSVSPGPGSSGPPVPLRTTQDAGGSSVFAHTLMLEVAGGPSVPVTTAQPLSVGAGSGPLLDASSAVGIGSITVLPAPVGGATRRHLEAQNVGATTIGINFGVPATLGAGSVVLGPLGSVRFAAPAYIPSDIVYAISSAAGGALTLKWA